MTRWTLVVARRAEQALRCLPDRVAPAIVEFMLGPLLDDPQRVGKPLQRELTSYHSARRGSYRIIYRIDADSGTVNVVRIEHRSQACRTR